MGAPEHLGKQFHGTNAELKPGDRVLPRSVTGVRQNAATWRDTSENISTTAHLPLAARYGEHVYVVKPVDVLGPDPEYAYGGAGSRVHPQARQTYDSREAVVVRRVSDDAVARARNFRPHHEVREGGMGVFSDRRGRVLDETKRHRRNQSRRQLEPDRFKHYGIGDDPPTFKPGTAGV